MPEFSEAIEIHAPINAVWRELSDIGAISQWNPGVKDSWQTTEGPVGIGSRRHCDLGGKNYLTEEVIQFEAPARITFRILETNLPFKNADIRFLVVETGTKQTRVTVSPVYSLKYGVVGRVLDALFVRSAYRKGMRALLNGFKSQLEATQ